MSGERLLLDSTFIAGLINSRDQLHLKAKDFLQLVETAAEVVITETVLIEVGNLLHSVQHRQRAAEFIDACYGTMNVTIRFRLVLWCGLYPQLALWATGMASAAPTGDKNLIERISLRVKH